MSKSWSSECINVIAPPGGLPLCLYSCCCFPCAAGDAAFHAGGNYCVSCLCTGCYFGGGFGPLILCQDRIALANKHGITDSCSPVMACLGMCCCTCCMVTQELNQELSSGKALKDVIMHIPNQEELMAAPASLIKSLTSALSSAGPELQKTKDAALEKK